MAGSDPLHCLLLAGVVILLVCLLRKNAKKEGFCWGNEVKCNTDGTKTKKLDEASCSVSTCCEGDLKCKKQLGFWGCLFGGGLGTDKDATTKCEK